MERQLHMLGQHKHDSKGKDNITEWDTIPVEDRIYVLRFIHGINNNRTGGRRYSYYTGKAVTERINKAKIFTLTQAKNTKQYAHTATAHNCEIKRVTRKMLFRAALQGI